jgi:PIN domain nuclease of toxin-antitoxin system
MTRQQNGGSEAPTRYPCVLLVAHWRQRVVAAAIADVQNEKYVSAITAWEFITKFRSGKEPGFAGIAADVVGAIAAQGFTELAITTRHAEFSARLPLHHKDPMDRFLIAQAIVEDMTIITADMVFGSYSAKLLW